MIKLLFNAKSKVRRKKNNQIYVSIELQWQGYLNKWMHLNAFGLRCASMSECLIIIISLRVLIDFHVVGWNDRAREITCVYFALKRAFNSLSTYNILSSGWYSNILLNDWIKSKSVLFYACNRWPPNHYPHNYT